MLTLYTTISTGMLFSSSTTHRMLNSKIIIIIILIIIIHQQHIKLKYNSLRAIKFSDELFLRSQSLLEFQVFHEWAIESFGNLKHIRESNRVLGCSLLIGDAEFVLRRCITCIWGLLRFRLDKLQCELEAREYMLFAGWEIRIVKNCDRGLSFSLHGPTLSR